jgi:hypothetical protein
MYRRPKFLEKLIEIRQEMALEADYDIDLFTELARSGAYPHREQQVADTPTLVARPPKAKIDNSR